MKRMHQVDSQLDGKKLVRSDLAIGRFVDEKPIVGFSQGSVQLFDPDLAPGWREEITIDRLLRRLNRGDAMLSEGCLQASDRLVINAKEHRIMTIGLTGQLALIPDGRSSYLGPIYKHWQDLIALGDAGRCQIIPRVRSGS